MIEVLSPAGSFESVKAAAATGADAVYIGASKFNARRNAENFSFQQLEETIKYCHKRGVKVYITLNTLVFDAELDEIVATAVSIAKMGADAFIVQDLGLAGVLKKVLPQIPLHASTQMSVNSAAALTLLSKMGFSRVVLARELDKTTISAFCREAQRFGVEVEIFVHGAQCMSLSGQCYLSSVLGCRSGNRGLCAQPCRLPFSVGDTAGYDLSLKDLSLIEYISELEEMGVKSLKIEGRMKSPEYVAVATAACRSYLSSGSVGEGLRSLLTDIFSRSGFTSGYYRNTVDKSMFGVRTRQDAILSAAAAKKIHELYRHEYKRVPVSAGLTVVRNEPVVLEISDGKNKVCVRGELPQPARTAEIDPGFAEDKISKMGDTPYYLESFKMQAQEGLTVLSSELTRLRRSALEMLDQKREVPREVKVNPFTRPDNENSKSAQLKFIARFCDCSQIPDNINSLSEIVLPIECDFEKYTSKSVPLAVEVPRWIAGREQFVEKRLEAAAQAGIKTAYCGNLSAVSLCKAAGLEPKADFGLNICNSESLSMVERFGCGAAVLSFENSVEQINGMVGNIKKGFIAYGRLPLMLHRNCPNKSRNGCHTCSGRFEITDRKGIKFPVICRDGFCEMLNSRPVWMFDKTDGFSGADFAVMYFTDETREECSETIAAAHKKQGPTKEYTRGLYYRKVK